jgi:hypothetical protein
VITSLHQTKYTSSLREWLLHFGEVKLHVWLLLKSFWLLPIFQVIPMQTKEVASVSITTQPHSIKQFSSLYTELWCFFYSYVTSLWKKIKMTERLRSQARSTGWPTDIFGFKFSKHVWQLFSSQHLWNSFQNKEKFLSCFVVVGIKFKCSGNDFADFWQLEVSHI